MLIVDMFTNSFVCVFVHDKSINLTPAPTDPNDLVRVAPSTDDDTSIALR